MNLTPLAQRIYEVLLQQRAHSNPLISYSDLVRALGALPPPDSTLKPNDERLFNAFDEIIRYCKAHQPPLPLLTAIVVRRKEDGTLGMPGSGFFASAFPTIRNEQDKTRLWQAEVERVVSYPYRTDRCSCAKREQKDPARPHHWLREPAVIAAMIGLAGTIIAGVLQVWWSSRPSEPSAPRPVDRVVVIVPQGEKAPPAEEAVAKAAQKDRGATPKAEQTDRGAAPKVEQKGPGALTLDNILTLLEKHHQRATFGAVAGVLGRDPRSLFEGYTRTPRTSWVVSKSTGLPTGFKKSDYPPTLLEREKIINSPEELERWLSERR